MGWSDEAFAHYGNERWRSLFLDDMGMTVLRINLLPLPLSARGVHELDVVRFGPDLDANVARLDYETSSRARLYGEVARALQAQAGPDGLKVIASVWTPPHFLKQGATLAHGRLDSGGGHLPMDADTLEQYGRYMTASVVAWERRFGVRIDALSIQNEPRFEQEYNSMALTPPQYAQALATVATAFTAAGLSTRLFGPEDVGPGPPGDRGLLEHQLSYIRAVMAEPTAAAAIDAFAVHAYAGNGIDSDGQAAPDNWSAYWSAIAAHGRPSWQTESGGGAPDWDHPGGPLMLANVIYEGMTYGQVSLWCNWMFSQPVPLDQHALLGQDLEIDAPKYAVAKHFFRFIRPGAQRLEVVPPQRDRVKVTAWHEPQRDRLTVVLINLRDGTVRFEVELGSVARGRTLSRWQTSSSANFESLPAVEALPGRLGLELPGRSVTTLSDAWP